MAGALLAFPTEAVTQDDAGLRNLVVSQAAMIEALQKRVAVLEEHDRAAADPATDDKASQPPAVRAGSSAPATPASADRFSIAWDEGSPSFSLADGTSFHVRGRLFIDASATSGSRFPARNISGTELSSARLGVDGRYGEHWSYKAELDFADGSASLKENYLGYSTKIGASDLKVYAGNKTGDRSIDGASYDGYVPFFQRTMLATSVGPEKGIFGVGLLAQIIGKDWHVGLNVVGDDANGNVGTSDDTLSYIGRATWGPSIDRLTRLHVGAWGYYETLSSGGGTITRAIYPGAHFNDNVRISMAPIEGAGSSTGEGAEAGIMRGAFWAFGEYGRRRIDAWPGSRTWTSTVAEAGYFLTGEKPNFSSRLGSWTEVEPRRSVFEGGPGAIEIAARYETTDLGRAAVGGSGYDMTVAVDWFLNRNVRAIADAVRWKISDPLAPYAGSDRGTTFNVRLETSF